MTKPGGDGRPQGKTGQTGLPSATHLQALVLARIGAASIDAPALIDDLARHDVTITRAGFTLVMQRLERAALVTVSYRQARLPSGQTATLAYYKRTAAGRKTLDGSIKFYGSLAKGCRS